MSNQAAMEARGIAADWTPASLAAHTQAVLQGAFILAKATGDRAIARESVDHLRPIKGEMREGRFWCVEFEGWPNARGDKYQRRKQ